MASEFYKTKKVKCIKCGKELEIIDSPYDRIQGIDSYANFICEDCVRKEYEGVLKKMQEIVTGRGHNVSLSIFSIKENDEFYFSKYKYSGKKYGVFINKVK